MKNKIIMLATVLGLALGFSMPSSAVSLEEAATKILGFIAKTKAGKKVICQQADVTEFIFSVRSFGGLGCKNKTIAAFAVKYCAGYGDFDGSGCDKEAKRVLGGENVNKVLGDQLTKGTEQEKKAICSVIEKEDMTPKQAEACKDVK